MCSAQYRCTVTRHYAPSTIWSRASISVHLARNPVDYVTNTIRNMLEWQVLPKCDESDKKWSKYHFILWIKPIFFLFSQTLVQQPHSEKTARDRGTIYGFHTKNGLKTKKRAENQKNRPQAGVSLPPIRFCLSVCRFGRNWGFCLFLTEKGC